jgi:hypothetical protein
MTSLQIKPRTDSWVLATWDDYINQLNDPIYQQAKGYYYSVLRNYVTQYPQ